MTTATTLPAHSAEAADAAAAAELIYSTDPGVWDYLFRGDRASFDRFAAGLWVLPGNSFSHSESVVVRDDTGTVMAMEMGYRGGDVELELRLAMRARGLGCDSIHLDVYTTNPAVGLYRAHGFRVAVESRFPEKEGLPPHFRMVKPL